MFGLVSIIGICVAYFIGQLIWWDQYGDFSQFTTLLFQLVPVFIIKTFNHIKTLNEKFDFFTVFTTGFTPFPYEVLNIGSVVFGISFSMFIIARFISRGSRSLLLLFIVKIYCNSITSFKNKYFNLLSIAFTILLKGRFFLYKVAF